MATVKRFEELEAWKVAKDLANSVYDMTKVGPLSRDFGLKDQMRRAAVSVMSNISEGFERDTTPDFIHFLFIAKGSAGELRSQLYLAIDQNLISQQQFDETSTRARRTSLLIARLISYLKSKIAK